MMKIQPHTVDKDLWVHSFQDSCDTVGELTWDFAFYVRKCFGLARVATDFLFYPKERSKSTGKTFEMFSWVGE